VLSKYKLSKLMACSRSRVDPAPRQVAAPPHCGWHYANLAGVAARHIIFGLVASYKFGGALNFSNRIANLRTTCLVASEARRCETTR